MAAELAWRAGPKGGDAGARSGHRIAVLDNHLAVLVGGWTVKGVEPCPIASAAFNLNTKSWQALGDVPSDLEPRAGACVVSAGANAVVFGGESLEGSVPLDDLYILSLQGNNIRCKQIARTGTWPDARGWAAASVVPAAPKVEGQVTPGARLVVHGGKGKSGLLNDTWVFDLDAHTWTKLEPTGDAPTARMYHTGTYFPATNSFVVLGGSDLGSQLDDAYSLNMFMPQWTKFTIQGTGPGKRCWHTATVVGVPPDLLPPAPAPVEVPETADAKKAKEKAAKDKKAPAKGKEAEPEPPAVVKDNTRIAVIGGFTGASVQDLSIFLFDPRTAFWSTWGNAPPAGTARHTHGCVATAIPGTGVETPADAGPDVQRVVPTSELTIIGGYSGVARCNDVVVYGQPVATDTLVETAPETTGELGWGVCDYKNGDHYEGKWSSGLRHGQGRCSYADGTQYVGEWKNDKRQGRGVLTLPSGSVYDGEWANDLQHGKGVHTYMGDGKYGELKYEGDWAEGFRHGHGVCSFVNGDVYEGAWLSGRRHGKGNLDCHDGTRYEGDWEDDTRHGTGLCRFGNRDEYTGTWAHDAQSGFGTMVYADGTVYTGQWWKGVRSGHGECHFANRDVYVGKWRQNQQCGRGICQYANGGRYEGVWDQGGRHGDGEMHYSNGDIYKGQWQNDGRSGRGTLTKTYGTEYVGQWANDKQHGQGECRYFSPTIRVLVASYTGEWRDGVRAGQGVCVYDSGNRYEGEWKDDMRHGNGTCWYETLQATYVGEWAKDKRHGTGRIDYKAPTPDCGTAAGIMWYNGQWMEDGQDGNGTAQYTNGEVYEGQWVSAARCGYGTATNATGDNYVGEWLNDNRHGRGRCTFASGDVYEGEWSHNLPHVEDAHWKGLSR